MITKIREKAFGLKVKTDRLLKARLLPGILPNKQVKYNSFSTSSENLEVFVNKQGEHPTKRLALEWLLRDPLLPARFSLLDVGCGPGVLAGMVSRHPELKDRIAYTGIDQSEGALAYCRSAYPGKYEFLRHDLQSSELPDRFDVVVISEVIEHLPSYHQLISAAIDKRPTIFILTTFGVVPGIKKDRQLWNHKEGCYMNSYRFDSLYEFLRSKTNELHVADLGTQTFDRYWFPKKTLLLFYLRLDADKTIWSPTGWINPSKPLDPKNKMSVACVE